MIGEGMKVRFVPAASVGDHMGWQRKREAVVGTIVHINWQHKHFTAEYDCGGSKQKENFKFCDIGEAVIICGQKTHERKAD